MDLPRAIRGAGTAESAWLPWLARHARARWPLGAVLPAAARLVALAPHPDDEVLACGGLLQMHAARGGRCLVLAATDGEASHAGVAGSLASELARARREESRLGLLQLAPAAEVLRLGLPDGGLAAHQGALLAALGRLLRPGDVVVSPWRLDGHPDHEASGEAAAQACADIGCRLLEAPIWMWHWSAPADPVVPWARLRGLELDPAALQSKARALRAHASQLRPRSSSLGPVLGAQILARAARSTEYFLA